MLLKLTSFRERRQILALCITGTNTFSGLLAQGGTSIPAFQNMFIYISLNVVYTSYTLYIYGFRKYGQMLLNDGWKCKCKIVLEFCNKD